MTSMNELNWSSGFILYHHFSPLALSWLQLYMYMKSRQLQWAKAASKAFVLIKQKLNTALDLLDFDSLNIELQCPLGLEIGVHVLSQSSRPVVHFGEKLSRSKLRYSTYVVESMHFINCSCSCGHRCLVSFI